MGRNGDEKKQEPKWHKDNVDFELRVFPKNKINVSKITWWGVGSYGDPCCLNDDLNDIGGKTLKKLNGEQLRDLAWLIAYVMQEVCNTAMFAGEGDYQELDAEGAFRYVLNMPPGQVDEIKKQVATKIKTSGIVKKFEWKVKPIKLMCPKCKGTELKIDAGHEKPLNIYEEIGDVFGKNTPKYNGCFIWRCGKCGQRYITLKPDLPVFEEKPQ